MRVTSETAAGEWHWRVLGPRFRGRRARALGPAGNNQPPGEAGGSQGALFGDPRGQWVYTSVSSFYTHKNFIFSEISLENGYYVQSADGLRTHF